MSAWLTVFFKEVLETLRDRRTLTSALLLGPLLGPLMLGGILWFVGQQQEKESSQPLRLPIEGQQNAPNLVSFLKQRGVTVTEAPADPEQSIIGQRNDVVLRISEDYAQAWNEGYPAHVELLYDGSRQIVERKVSRARELLRHYSALIGALRLQVRGVSPELAAALDVSDDDLSTPLSRAAFMLSMLPFLVILSAFSGSMNIAIDATTGERERQSLEALLITPVPRSQIMAGKLAATTFFALAGLLVCIGGFALVTGFAPQGGKVEMSLSAQTVLQIFVIALPVTLLSASAQMIVASAANSFKEAQSYLQVFLFVPMIPSLVQSLSPLKPEYWVLATPFLGQSVLIDRALRGEEILFTQLFASMGSMLALALLLCLVTVRLYEREKLAFG